MISLSSRTDVRDLAQKQWMFFRNQMIKTPIARSLALLGMTVRA
jgi:hypothetical protein